FLNPVTDAIAPGYSKVIKKPMSIGTMINKIENNQYHDIKTWEQDVRLMFKNCVDYN
ncbi:Bromodomain-containing protein, partial [Fragilariopsis cylindrus CCMP1102]